MEIIVEWDTKKAQVNLQKHKVGFEEAQTVFADPFLVTFRDEFHSQSEDRFISIGMSTRERVLLVVHTGSEESSERITVRIISCRKATSSERKIYEENE